MTNSMHDSRTLKTQSPAHADVSDTHTADRSVFSSLRTLRLLLFVLIFGILLFGIVLSLLVVWITPDLSLIFNNGTQRDVSVRRLPETFSSTLLDDPVLNTLRTFRSSANETPAPLTPL